MEFKYFIMQCRPIVIHSDSFICLPERHLRVDNGVQCILAVLLPEWVGYSWGFLLERAKNRPCSLNNHFINAWDVLHPKTLLYN